MSRTLAELWCVADKAKPRDWRVMGLCCASSGLLPEQRSEKWGAEACGPDGACIKIEAPRPEDALEGLTSELVRLRDTAPAN